MNFFAVTPSLKPSRYASSEALSGEHTTEMIVTVQLRANRPRYRFGLGFICANGQSRRVSHGPILRGPWAYAYGLSTGISADPRMSTRAEMTAARDAGLVIDADLGDVLIFQGSLWRIDRDHNDNLKLVQVTLTVTDAPAPQEQPS